MYAVDDEVFQQARAIVVTLAGELEAQRASGSRQAVDLHDLVRRSAPVAAPPDDEVAYLGALAERMQKTFPVEELFPRRRRAGSQ